MDFLLELRCLQPVTTTASAIAPARDPRPWINVAAWFRDRLDTLAQELSWMLMPALTPTMAELRSGDAFTHLQTALAAQGLVIPLEARGAYQDIITAPTNLRLYAVTWTTAGETGDLEWTFLVALGTDVHGDLPVRTELVVCSDHHILTEQTVERPAVPYLYTCVEGSLEEQFQVEIGLSDGTVHRLPPFGFQQE
jgi:hypothetical protein